MLHDVLSLFHLFLFKQNLLKFLIVLFFFFFSNTYNFILRRSGRY